MKISIEGFDQSRAVELGLCAADMVLLRSGRLKCSKESAG